MEKTSFLITLVLISTGFFMMTFRCIPVYAEDYKIITDMCDNKVEVPVNPKRIACMHCVSPEKIMTLGKGIPYA